MHLLWKLLRRHLSVGQLTGFFLANMLGMTVILLSIQFYSDIAPSLQGEDSVMPSDYIMVSKRIGTVSSSQMTFSSAEQETLAGQPFVERLGAFTASRYRVKCQVGMHGVRFSTDMFFESVPDDFIDINNKLWQWHEGEPVPIVLPKAYLSLYNFGFAQSQNLPQIGEGLVGLLDISVELIGEEKRDIMPARLAGFSSRLNTILVPQTFIEWSNGLYAPSSVATQPSRLIMKVYNPTDERLTRYAKDNGYDIDEDKLQAGKTMYFLKVVIAIVIAIGVLISALSFYVLMLSIFLLVQKNQEKLQTLMLIGYSTRQVSVPYQCLCLTVNLAVLLCAITVTCVIRSLYMERLWQMFPTMQEASLYTMTVTGVLLFVCVSVLNATVIYNKLNRLWKHS